MTITTLGIDIAKSVFQLHGVDANGAIVLQKKLRRAAVLDVLGKLVPLPDRHGGLCYVTSLGA